MVRIKFSSPSRYILPKLSSDPYCRTTCDSNTSHRATGSLGTQRDISGAANAVPVSNTANSVQIIFLITTLYLNIHIIYYIKKEWIYHSFFVHNYLYKPIEAFHKNLALFYRPLFL